MSTITMPDARRAPDAASSAPAFAADHLAQLRDALEEQRAFRLDQLAELHRAAWRGYPSDVDRQIGQSLTAGARAALYDVLAALHRMDVGSFGRCDACGTALEAERLEVIPQTPRCTRCQRAVESAAPAAASTRLGGREHPDAGGRREHGA